MLTVLLVSTLLTFILYFVYKWNKVKKYWADRNVPFDEPHFVLGSLTFLQRLNPITWLRQLYDRYPDSPYVGIWLLWRPALVINSPEISRKILVKDSEVFRNRLLSSGSNDPIGSLNIFTVDDPLWTSMRRRLTAMFTSARLRSGHTLQQTKKKELVQRLRMETDKNNRINLRDIFANYTTDIIGITSFGIESNATLTGDSPMRRVTRDFMAYNLWRGLAWCSIFFVPELVPFFGFTFFPKSSVAYFRKVFSQIVQQRNTDHVQHKDLLDALLKIKKEAEVNGEEITDDMLIAQGAIFLQGGFDTTAVNLSFSIYELAQNPNIQEKLYEELFAAKEKYGSDEFDPNTLRQLTYLNCVINESLRKYPAMGWLDRKASTTYKIDENLTIEKGTTIYINAAGMHYDPKYFPEPLKFDPDRFLPENERNIKPFTYMPFGEGPRSCIGIRFAYQTLCNALSAIILNFKLEPYPDAVPPSELKIDKRGMFLAPEAVLSVQFMPREY